MLSCRKADFNELNYPNNSNATVQNFFEKNKPTDANGANIVAYLKRIEGKHHFVNTTVARIGYPRFDKIIETRPSYNTNLLGNGDSNHVFIIPFVRDTQNFVNASMIIHTNPTDTTVSYRCDWQYKDFDYATSSSYESAESYAAFFMLQDRAVFGYEEFSILDSSLFRQNNKPATKVRFDTSQQSSVLNWEVSCTPYSVIFEDYCDVLPRTSSIRPTCQFELVYDYCQGSWVDDGIWPTSGGPGTGGTSGSGGGSTYTPPDCSGTPENPLVSNIATPCGDEDGGGWVPMDDEVFIDINWFNLQPNYKVDLSGLDNYPCAKTIVTDVLGLSNNTISIINSLFSETTKFNLKFVVDPTLGSEVVGKATRSAAFFKSDGIYGKLSYLDVTISLNPAYLLESTKLYLAQTVIHELVHAYFFYRSYDAQGDPVKEQLLANELGFLKPFDPNATPSTYGNQHEQMASNYRNLMKNALMEYRTLTSADLTSVQTFYPSIDVSSYYEALTWGGLDGDINGSITKSWDNFRNNNPVLASMYQNIIALEKAGNPNSASKDKCQ